MTSSHSPAAGPVRFSSRRVPADGPTAAWIREEFTRWLRRSTGLDETGMCDVVLAVNEAVANAAEFAYPQDRRPGTLDVEAVLQDGVLRITIADRGRWRHTDPARRPRSRGRGIPLMRTLADDVTIDASESGTSVTLRFGPVYAYRDADMMV